MTKRPVWALLAVAVAAIILVVIYLPTRGVGNSEGQVAPDGTTSPSASGSKSGSKSPSKSPSGSPSSTASVEPSGDFPGVTNPAEAQPDIDLPDLEAGGKPPQFVVMSFDGGVETKYEIFKHYLDLADRIDGRFSFNYSAVYGLPDNKERLRYSPPRKPKGTSAIGFGDPKMMQVRMERLAEAWKGGHEFATHFNGHFCGAGGVGTWNQAEWTSEITQWNSFVDNWQEANPQVKSDVKLPFSSAVVKGGRTPCLEGKRGPMFKAFKAAGYTYDSSDTAGLRWPTYMEKYGLWEIPLQLIKVPGQKIMTLSMDYNLMVTQNGGKTTAPQAKCDQIEKQSYQAYTDAFKAVYNGNRAPLNLGNHMNDWVCDAYTNALTKFAEDAKKQHPDVHFISNEDLVKWMEKQDPALLKVWTDKGTQKY